MPIPTVARDSLDVAEGKFNSVENPLSVLFSEKEPHQIFRLLTVISKTEHPILSAESIVDELIRNLCRRLIPVEFA